MNLLLLTNKNFLKGFLVFSYFCMTNILSASTVGDSIHYLTPKDTIFLEVGKYQEKVFQHTVSEKQTLYSLSKFYGLSLELLYYYNPFLRTKVLSIDDKLTIPIPNRSIIRYKNKKFKQEEHVPIIYRVQKGDNLFRIARVHFRMPVDSVMSRNQLSDYTIHIGQELLLGWMNINGIPEKYQRTKNHLEKLRNQANARKFESIRARSGKKAYYEQGVAYWQKDAQVKTSLYALHRTAAINTTIAVENPMQKKTILVKVIGRIPVTAYSREVILVLSPTAARQLGAKDARFFVKIKYLR